MRRWPALPRLLTRLFPDDFRSVHGAGLAEDYPGPADGAPPWARAWYWTRVTLDLAWAVCGVWWDRLRTGREVEAMGERTTRRNTMENLTADIRLAVRTLRRAPAFTTMAVLTIALGLGANAAIFSVVNGVLLRPLPYEDADELTRVWGRFLPESGFDFPYFSIDPTEYLDVRDQSSAFESVAAYGNGSFALTREGGAAERWVGLITTWNLFDLLGVEAALGRTLVPEDDVPGGPNVAVLSHSMWQDRFGADPTVVGTTVTMNRQSYEIVGVLPEGFAFPSPNVDLYVPQQLSENPSNRQSHYLGVIARRADGVALEAAQADIARMMSAWEAEYPDIHTGHFLFLEDFKGAMVRTVRPALIMLMGAVAFVLLVACTNVANLLLVRGHGRDGEVAVRQALGASRWRIVQLSLAESTILAMAGAVVGLVAARYGVSGLLSLASGTIPLADTVSVDGTVLAYTLGLTVMTALVFGLVPALRGVRRAAAIQLREDARGGTASRGRVRARNLLVASEVALSFVLIIGAGLMTRSVINLLGEDPGFDASDALVANFSLPFAAYSDLGDGADFLDEVVAEASALPGVSDVTHVAHLPMRGGQSVNDFEILGRPEPGPGQPAWNAGVTAVRANYFDVMGIPVLAGRGFDPTLDRADGVPAVVISESLADRFFSGVDPLGSQMRFSGSDDTQPWWTVVGVVGDVQYQALGSTGSPMYYVQTEQIAAINAGTGYERFGTLVVRTDLGSPLDFAEPLRQVVARIDPDLPLTSFATLETVVTDSVGRPLFIMSLMGAFAGLALLLGAIGIYGVTSFAVSQRLHEIGIRKALGAAGGEVASLVIRQGMAPVAAGMTLGVLGAVASGRLLASLLYGVAPSDVATYVAVLAVLGTVALTALWLPARRAARLDPMVSLRNE